MSSKQIIIIAIAAFGLLLLVLFYSKGDRPKNRFDWMENYRSDSNQPYGTKYIEKMLESSHSGKTTIVQKETLHQFFEGKKFTNTDYIVIGESVFLDMEDVDALKHFIDDGNNVFMATTDAPELLINTIYTNTCTTNFNYSYDFDSVVYANFFHKNLHKSGGYPFKYRLGADDEKYSWFTLDPAVICDSTIEFTPIGYQDDNKVNFLRIPYGSNGGNLYLHTVPLMFTNYFMTKADKMEYASAAFSHLSGNDLIWDEVSKLPFSENKNKYDSPLYYIMQQPALKYAWWMLLIGTLLYVVFASKRTQRIIPVLEPKTNTSLEFLTVISSLHYQNPDHLDMARKKMKYFLYFIRAKYGINTQTFTADHVKRLAEKSKVDIADVQAIHDRYKTVESYGEFNEEPDRLVALYQAIEKFYKTCK